MPKRCGDVVMSYISKNWLMQWTARRRRVVMFCCTTCSRMLIFADICELHNLSSYSFFFVPSHHLASPPPFFLIKIIICRCCNFWSVFLEHSNSQNVQYRCGSYTSFHLTAKTVRLIQEIDAQQPPIKLTTDGFLLYKQTNQRKQTNKQTKQKRQYACLLS